MTSGREEPPRLGPVARFFGSLANALIDLGLPTIRDWLRDRLGPSADVGQVTSEGKLVHLHGVRVPIGPRGLLVLERATAAITGVGSAGLPEIRLHAFVGVLSFGDGVTQSFRAEVSFAAAPEPDESAWIWGDLAIQNAAWSERPGSPPANPMAGRARLFVSSREWRLDAGRLDGEIVRAHFAGRGVFEQGRPAPSDVAPVRRVLVPSVLSAFALTLEHARIGSFVDAASALVGHAIDVPSFVPRNAALDGDLAWTNTEGASADLRVGSEAIRGRVHGRFNQAGGDLSGRVDAEIRPALLMRASDLPHAAIPSDEDVVHVALDVSGELQRPEVSGTLRAKELGFRLGRPRFVPPVVVRALESEIFVKDDRAVIRAVAEARGSRVTVDIDCNVRALASARGTLRAPAIEPAFLREIITTLGSPVHLPEDLSAAIELSWGPRAESGPAVDGQVTLATPRSNVVLAITHAGMRLTGAVDASDAVATRLFGGAVFPVGGALALGLDVFLERGRVWAHGRAESKALTLAVRDREDVAPYVLEGVAADVAIDRAGLVYGQLEFAAYGARFLANGTIPFDGDRVRREHNPFLVLKLQSGGATLAQALGRLEERVRIRASHEGMRSSDEIWLPPDLTADGELRIEADLSSTLELNLGTTAGTALAASLKLGEGLVGSTLIGKLALRDALATGVFPAPVHADGVVDVHVVVARYTTAGPVFLIGWGAERLDVVAAGATFGISNATGAVRVSPGEVAWQGVDLHAFTGAVTSSGFRSGDGVVHARVSFSQVAVHELPAIAERSVSSIVRGRLSGSIIGRGAAVQKETDRVDVGRERLRLHGDLLLDDAAFPALDLVRPTLARYGLRPPNEAATAPVTATLVHHRDGVALRDVRADLRGASIRGHVAISRGRELAGDAEVTLETEYLRTSKLLTLPRVLTNRITLPIRLRGTLAAPSLRAGLAESLGHFLADNRVSAFVTSAVEEAQIALGRPPAIRGTRGEGRSDERHARAPGDDAELDAELRRTLDAHADDWERIARARQRR